MTAGQIRAAGQAAVTPAQRLANALAAVHAARSQAIRELTLDDIDLPSRRIWPATGSASASSPATPCWPGSDTGVPPGRTPPAGLDVLISLPKPPPERR